MTLGGQSSHEKRLGGGALCTHRLPFCLPRAKPWKRNVLRKCLLSEGWGGGWRDDMALTLTTVVSVRSGLVSVPSPSTRR